MNARHCDENSRAPSAGSRGFITERGARVLALAAEAWGGRGGIAQSTRDLLGAMAGQSNVAQIEILPRLCSEPVPARPNGILQHPPSAARFGYACRALWLAATRRFDIVYCGHVYMAPLAHLVAQVTRAKLMSHMHGLEVWQPLASPVRRSLAASDMILCVSHHTAGKAADTVGVNPDRCTVIYNTVGDAFLPGDRAAARRRFNIPAQARVLSTVARLDPRQRHKGHDRVIPLLPDLARAVPSLIYLVAGTGGDRDRLQALARDTGAGDIVRFLGFVADDDLPDLYRASDLYVMPSHGEGFGIAFIEAMACGTPALGLDLGGAPDALRDGELGRAVATADFPQALRAAVLASPPDRLDLSARTRAIFGRTKFRERVAEATAPLLPGSAIADEALS